MNIEHKIEDFLDMYYLDTNIPMYLYTDNVCSLCVPRQTALTFPPQKYIHILYAESGPISYCSTDYGIYFGCLKLNFSAKKHLIMGPVSNIPYADSTLLNMYRDYVIPNEDKELFHSFLDQIPHTPLVSLLTKLIFINYCLHGKRLSISDFLPNTSVSLSDTALLTKLNYDKKENFLYNKSYVLEETIMELVRTGDTKGFQSLQLNDANFHIGITGDTVLRQLKNNIIITATLCTRAAIDGGLDYDTAYELSDRFIQTAEQMQTSDGLYDLQLKICYTFTEKVAQAKVPISSNGRLQKAIHFIQQNINQHITVSDVARYVGFSKSYFSAYFKDNMGFTVSAFILRCKLEEGRRLLQFTDKPIITISTYLCFSSQSHFQTAFKKQFGMTPAQYRQQNECQLLLQR